MTKRIRLITLFLICGLLTLTACDAVPREQTVTTTAMQTVTEVNPEKMTTAAIMSESTTEAETSAATVPPAKIKPIRSISLYTYNAYAASSARYGYHFYCFSPDRIIWGRTKKTPINTDDPLSTENMELMVSVIPSEGVFEAICEDMWELRFDLLPSRLDADRGTVMDHSEYTLTVIFEDGSSKTSSGYAATEMSDTYLQVVRYLNAWAEKHRYDSRSRA